jgi:hypothetical protein
MGVALVPRWCGLKRSLEFADVHLMKWKLDATETRGVWHCCLAIYIIKKYPKAKEELSKLKYFTMQKYNLPKIL